jgi:ATP-dependent Lhr-like helicase
MRTAWRRRFRSGLAKRRDAATSCRNRCPSCARTWLRCCGAILPDTRRCIGTNDCATIPAAAEQLVEYLAAGHAALGCLPAQDNIVLERFFDEAGGMQLIVHSPYGSRINRAWGLALRKRFCRKFNFELQAAATEDNIVISLTHAHSFALEEVARYLNSNSVRTVLTHALLDSPMFTTRWRWVIGIALALPRFRGGKKVPPQLARMGAEDLIGGSVPRPDRLRGEPCR